MKRIINFPLFTTTSLSVFAIFMVIVFGSCDNKRLKIQGKDVGFNQSGTTAKTATGQIANITQWCETKLTYTGLNWFNCTSYEDGEFWIEVDMGYYNPGMQWNLDNGYARAYFRNIGATNWTCVTCTGKAVVLPNGHSGVRVNLSNDLPYAAIKGGGWKYDGPECIEVAFYEYGDPICYPGEPSNLLPFEICYVRCNTNPDIGLE